MTTHREVINAIRLVDSDLESTDRSEAVKLIAELVLQSCGHPAPTSVDVDLEIRLTDCVVCFAYYTYTVQATHNRQLVGQIVRRHLLAQAHDRMATT